MRKKNGKFDVTDEQIQAFYDSNPTMFQLPESADVQYVRISRDDVAEGIEIGDDRLAQYYEDEKYRYLQDEQRQARHILIQFGDDENAARTQAEDILMRIRAGDSFEALAEEFSMDGGTAAQGGDFGALTESQLPEALGAAVFAMEEGALEGPVRSDFGFHIIRLDEILARGPLPLDQVRGELLAELRDREAESLYLELERRLSDALFDMTDMQAIADKYFHLPCSVMTSNEERLDLVRSLVAEYRADCVIDLVWQARPQTVLFEAANPRHAHEWEAFKTVKLPDDKILCPGVIEPQSNYIEHPELVAQRIERYANLVGRERVMAGVDCGFSVHVGIQGIDPDVAWAKLKTLAEGAAIATDRLW